MRKSDIHEVLENLQSLEDYLKGQLELDQRPTRHRKALQFTRAIQSALNDGHLEEAEYQTGLLRRYSMDHLGLSDRLMRPLNYLCKHVPRLSP